MECGHYFSLMQKWMSTDTQDLVVDLCELLHSCASVYTYKYIIIYQN